MEKKRNTKMFLLSIYLFVLIFQPQIIPISTIYILGVITILLLAFENNGKIYLEVMTKSGMLKLYKAFLLLAVYVVVVSVLDLASGGVSVFDNRLRCLNQLIVLTGIEFICISFFFRKCDKYGFDLQDMIHMLAIAGVLQGACSVGAYLIPQLRTFFLRYNGEVFRNNYVLERRGYGFSNILLDTYGYGMGLIAGATLLSKSLKVWQKWIIIPLCLISIVLNARTGIIVFAIVVIIYLFQSNTLSKFFLKSALAVIIIYFLWSVAMPIIMQQLLSSSSTTIKWIGEGLEDILRVLNGSSNLNEATSLSSFSYYPDSMLTILLGSGHNVYGISQVIGFHSDVGFINYLWEFGIIGTVIMAIALIKIYLKCFKISINSDKFLVFFLMTSYITVLFKGILIGYNPGIVVNYLLCFSIIYCGSRASI